MSLRKPHAQTSTGVAAQVLIASLALSMAVGVIQAQPSSGGPSQVGYASNLGTGGSFVNLSNSTSGTMCATVYEFGADEELLDCFSCSLAANSAAFFSVPNGSQPLDFVLFGSNGTCPGSGNVTLASGLFASTSTQHLNTHTGSYFGTVSPFQNVDFGVTQAQTCQATMSACQAGTASGTINVSTNLAAATFTITGPATYMGTGTSFMQTNAPAGEYTIVFGAVAGYQTPAPQSMFLAPGGTITFTGTYVPIGAINVSTNLSAATFTITGPATYTGSGTSFTQPVAPGGTYTIVFGAVAGYQTPASQSLTLSAGGTITFVGIYIPLGAQQVHYLSNLNVGDSNINITNTGSSDGPGNLCVNVYAFDPSEEMVACCACPVTPNALVSLSAQADLIGNTISPSTPTSLVVELLATPATGTTCNPSTPAISNLAPGLRAWATTLHALPGTGSYGITEGAFLPSLVGLAEVQHLTSFCGFIQSNGSGFGICKSCRADGLGGAKH